MKLRIRRPSNRTAHPGSGSYSSPGFSLIEVAVTIAIAAFIVSTVVTVVPMALSWHRDSIQESVMSAAVQELVREIEQAPFYGGTGGSKRSVQYYDRKKFYFDFEGTRFPDDVDPSDVVFQAKVFILDGGINDLDSDAVLERDPTAATSPTVKRAVVAVLFKPGDKSAILAEVVPGQDGVSTLQPKQDVKLYSLLIADRGSES